MKNFLETCFRKEEKVAWRTLDKDCILLHLTSGIYYTLNDVGTFLWESFDGKRRLQDIYEEMLDRYEVDPEVAKNDLFELIEDLMKEGLVKHVEKP
jgi:hypothetical protein